jgi:hypothetical protein
MFHFKIYQYKKLFGLKYTFPKRGDGIPLHTHSEDEKHNVVVMKGSVEVYGPGKQWSKTLTAGEVFDLEDEHHPHEIVALEDDTIILGLNVIGRPNLPADFGCRADLEGTIDKPLTIPLVGPFGDK